MADLKDMLRVVEWWRESPAGKAAAQSAEDARQKARREAYASRAAALERLEREAPAANARIEKATGELRKAREAVVRAEGALSSAIAERRALVYSAERAAEQAESALRKTASPAIGVAVTELRSKAEVFRRDWRHETRFDGGQNVYGAGLPPIFSTRPAGLRHLEALGKAVDEVESLALLPISDTEVAERIAAILAALPDPNEFERIV